MLALPLESTAALPIESKGRLRQWLSRCWLLLVSIVLGCVTVSFQHALETVFSPFNWLSTYLVGLILRLTGALGQHADVAKLFTAHLFGEVGVALIVAGIVGMFVENTLRRQEERKREEYLQEDERRHQRHLKELQENVFNYLLGRFAPSWLADKVVGLYRTGFLRQGLEITYRFTPPPKVLEPLENHSLPNPAELITVSVHLHYFLLNLADIEAVCEFGHGFEPTVPLGGTPNRFTWMSVLQSKGPGLGGPGAPQETFIGKQPDAPDPSKKSQRELKWKEGENHDCIKFASNVESSSLQWKSQTIWVQNFRMGARNKMEVDVCHESVRWRYDHDTWVSRLPAEGLRVIVEVDRAVAPLKFFLAESHPASFTEKTPTTWELEDQVLPYQGFTLHWFPASEAGQLDDAATPEPKTVDSMNSAV